MTNMGQCFTSASRVCSRAKHVGSKQVIAGKVAQHFLSVGARNRLQFTNEMLLVTC